MEGFSGFPSDDALSGASENAAPNDVAAAIGTDERRMHVRAYNYWVSLLDGRDFPSIEDLEPTDLTDFSAHSVLLDFTCGRDNPALPFIGAEIREECGLDDDMRMIAEVPARSLLSRLTDHYMQIIANRSPVGFEAEFVNQRGLSICYRGILMPFSSDGDTIDFIYGVINWKAEEDELPAAAPLAAVLPIAAELPAELPVEIPAAAVEEDLLDLVEEVAADDVDADGDDYDDQDADDGAEDRADAPSERQFGSLIKALGPARVKPQPPVTDVPRAAPRFAQPAPRALDFEPLDEPVSTIAPSFEVELPDPSLDDDSGLADRLVAARECAEAAKAGEGRTRAALYQALGLAYDFALAARAEPDDFAELLADSGVTAQARAPMTPIVKLVFGIDYDKARLTEFAAALSYADRQSIPQGGFDGFIGASQGLKALVAAERRARRPGHAAPDKGDEARAELRSRAPLALDDLAGDQEFAVAVLRRLPDGRIQLVAVLDDESLAERVIRKVA